MGANVRFIRNNLTNYANAFPSYSYGRGSLVGLGSDIAGYTNAYLAQLTGNPSIRLTDAATVERAFGDLLGLVSSGTQTVAYDRNGNPLAIGTPTVRNFASNELEGYLSDNWHMNASTTVSLGMR